MELLSLYVRTDIFDPNEISKITGLTPTGAFSIGDPIHPRKIASKAVWYLNGDKVDGDKNFNWHWKKFHKKIYGLENQFLHASQACDVLFVLELYIITGDYVPGIILNHNTLLEIVAFGFQLEFNITS